MINLSTGLQIDPLVEHNKVKPTETNLEFKDWIGYNELAFDRLSLGEVISLLECLRKEVELEEVFDDSDSVSLTKTKKQQVIAKWNNTLTVARIKSFIQASKEAAKHACSLSKKY